MDPKEYLAFIEILRVTRGSVEDVIETLLPNASDERARLRMVVAYLDRAIQAYAEKADAARS
jgi:hypothetical protein